MSSIAPLDGSSQPIPSRVSWPPGGLHIMSQTIVAGEHLNARSGIQIGAFVPSPSKGFAERDCLNRCRSGCRSWCTRTLQVGMPACTAGRQTRLTAGRAQNAVLSAPELKAEVQKVIDPGSTSGSEDDEDGTRSFAQELQSTKRASTNGSSPLLAKNAMTESKTPKFAGQVRRRHSDVHRLSCI